MGIDQGLPRAGSLRKRLFAWLLVPMAALAVISMAGAYVAAYRFANDVYDRWISDTTIALSQLSRVDAGRITVDLPAAAQHMLASDQRDRIYYRIGDTEGRFIAGHRDLPSPPSPPVPNAEPIRYGGTLNGDKVRIAAYRPVHLPVVVQVAETVKKRDVLALEIVAGTAVPLLLLVLLGAGGLWLGVERGLRPLTDIAQQIEGRSAQALHALDLSATPAEVRPLVEALNGLLARVDEMMSAQRRFVADAAHQLRTPITGLKTQAEMALRTQDPDNLHATLENVVAGASRMSVLVSQLLALARAEPEASRFARFGTVDAVALARRVTAGWIPRALEHSIDLGFEDHADRADVRGDPTLLREMLSNLIDNALKYSPAGGAVTVSVALRGQEVVIGVADSGPGVPPEERERVFERFHRTADSTVAGTGLGLAIVREIATTHGGKVQIGDAPGGKGTLATVCIPAGAAERVAV